MIGDVPLCDETRGALVRSGLQVEETLGQTERWGQAVLVLRSPPEESEETPDCYLQYDPEDALCRGCVWAASCWSRSGSYLAALRAGEVERPFGVPDAVVDEKIKARAVAIQRPTRPQPKKPPAIRLGGAR